MIILRVASFRSGCGVHLYSFLPILVPTWRFSANTASTRHPGWLWCCNQQVHNPSPCFSLSDVRLTTATCSNADQLWHKRRRAKADSVDSPNLTADLQFRRSSCLISRPRLRRRRRWLKIQQAADRPRNWPVHTAVDVSRRCSHFVRQTVFMNTSRVAANISQCLPRASRLEQDACMFSTLRPVSKCNLSFWRPQVKYSLPSADFH